MCELQDFAAVPFHIITPKDGKPVVEVVQDTMLGSYRISKSHVRIHDKVMANLQMVNSYFTGELDAPVDVKSNQYSGRQAFSGILPPALHIRTSNSDKASLKIENSKLLDGGVVDKSVFHAMSSGILPVIFHDYGPFEVRRYLDNLQRLICRWLMTSGFSVGISDLVVDPATASNLKNTITTMKQKAYTQIEEMRKGSLRNMSIMNNHDYFEREIMNILNDSTKEVGKIGRKTIDDMTNRMINMVKSGSKGKETNVAQMIACVGQQNVDGKRVAYGFTDRTLPHYTKYDDGAEARGYVENSFISGLTPQEVFFHAMGGREGLIDTAVKSVTAETPIFILEDGKPKYVRIGDWIDAHLNASKENVKHFTERRMEMLYLDRPVFIPTSDDDGKITWGELTAVTRHDPGTELYKVTTLGGRTVIVTECKSLLVWDGKQFKEKATPEVKVGDFLPVTVNLPEPPVVITHVDMTEYFPKNEYVHGSEYNKAVQLMDDAMGDKFHIPRGWWATNNGTTFTVPHPSKARFQRAIVRSNTENIKDGCIYPFHAKRDQALIPDKFELTYENGLFIGLFLADGCSCEKSGNVMITKDDTCIQTFVINWFNKYAINHRIAVDKKLHGTSTSVVGYSILLARFLDQFVGVGARHKYVPDVAFVAPLEFVKGILSGYISGDGYVGDGGVTTSSASPRLTHGISMLCSRIGVFGKISISQIESNNFGTVDIALSHRFNIRAQWVQKLADNLTLVMDRKDALLRELKISTSHRNFEPHNDVVMDAITEITVIGVEDYPKVYDVTVPSTLNFTLQNGLNVRDTSETGYIQRRLVKAMEDEKIYYDNTVRNAASSIIQFLYGEDGIEGTKIEKHFIPCIEMSLVELDQTFMLSRSDHFEVHMFPNTLSAMKDEPKDWAKRCEEHFTQLLHDRDYIIRNVFNGDKDATIYYPIAFHRIIRTACERMKSVGLHALPSDLTPNYILDKIEELQKELVVADPTQGTLYARFLIETNLSPKPMIFKHHMKKEMFDWIVEEIRRSFKESIAAAGEMVGIIAAQSLGEPCTQLSASKSTKIRITTGKDNAKGSHTGEIGTFIDHLLKQNAKDVLDLGNDSTALYLKDDYYIVGVSNDEKTSWRRILEVSRHPAHGGMVTVKTRSGRKTTATLSHSFLKRTKEGSIVPIEGSNLKLGDRIPVTRFIPTIENPLMSIDVNDEMYALDKDFGWIIGAYLADGCAHSNVTISKVAPEFEQRIKQFAIEHDFTLRVRETTGCFKDDPVYKDRIYKSKQLIIGGEGSYKLAQWFIQHFNTGSYKKRIPAWVYASNQEFIAGIVSGYFDGDGNVNVEKQMIRCHSVNEGLIEDMSILLNYCGIFATKLIETRKREKANLFHVLSVSKKYAQIFKDIVGFSIEHKADNLDCIIEYNDRDDIHSSQEVVDQIPECAESIAYIGERLKFPGQSRLYKRWLKKPSIGRRTLEKYIALFKATNDLAGNLPDVNAHIKLLEQAVNANVIWDEIVELEYLPDPKEYVYDFTVPGNDSFMVDNGILVHNTLDSFHVSGTAAAVKATSGVPRLKELLSVSRNIKTPSLKIYLKEDIGSVVNPVEDDDETTTDPRITESKERSMKILHQLQITRLQNLLEFTEIFWDPPGEKGYDTRIKDDKELMEMYREVVSMHSDTLSSWVLRMKVNRQKLLSSRLTMLDIYIKIYESYSQLGECVFSDDNAEHLIFRIRLDKKAMKDSAEEDSIAALKALEQSLVQQVLLKGTEKIKKVSMRRHNSNRYNAIDKQFDRLSEWVLDTDGSNLASILSNPNIDKTRTISNDVFEIYNVLGIEAARTALDNEIMDVIKESSVNYRHLSLLIDTMTHKGTLMSIDRHGINRGDVGPLAKSSFEETTDMLINASIFSDYDKINGVSANIMLGQLPPCGTGDSEILLDEALYISLMKQYNTAKKKRMIDEDLAPIDEEPDACSQQCLAIPLDNLPKKHVPRKWLNMLNVDF